MPATKIPSMHHPRRGNVTVSVVELKKWSHAQKSHQNGDRMGELGGLYTPETEDSAISNAFFSFFRLLPPFGVALHFCVATTSKEHTSSVNLQTPYQMQKNGLVSNAQAFSQTLCSWPWVLQLLQKEQFFAGIAWPCMYECVCFMLHYCSRSMTTHPQPPPPQDHSK